ncbi:IS66 family transposase [Nonomuraea glycinis]|uniref:IS66 family transposase n=1 Tax=Nonomuraea glycinis TaxID=2047744 RepID=UPI00389A2EAE
MAHPDSLGSGGVEQTGWQGPRGRTGRDPTRASQGLPQVLPPRHPHRAVVASSHARTQTVPGRNLLERLQRRVCDVLRFADFPGWVPFTNNAAERALRPVKTQVKISGCHQSRSVTDPSECLHPFTNRVTLDLPLMP